jgi:hypothetical protein
MVDTCKPIPFFEPKAEFRLSGGEKSLFVAGVVSAENWAFTIVNASTFGDTKIGQIGGHRQRSKQLVVDASPSKNYVAFLAPTLQLWHETEQTKEIEFTEEILGLRVTDKGIIFAMTRKAIRCFVDGGLLKSILLGVNPRLCFLSTTGVFHYFHERKLNRISEGDAFTVSLIPEFSGFGPTELGFVGEFLYVMDKDDKGIQLLYLEKEFLYVEGDKGIVASKCDLCSGKIQCVEILDNNPRLLLIGIQDGDNMIVRFRQELAPTDRIHNLEDAGLWEQAEHFARRDTPDRVSRTLTACISHHLRTGKTATALEKCKRSITEVDPAEVIKIFGDLRHSGLLLEYLREVNQKGLADRAHITLLMMCLVREGRHRAAEELHGEIEDVMGRVQRENGDIDVLAVASVLTRSGFTDSARHLLIVRGQCEEYMRLLYEAPEGPLYSDMLTILLLPDSSGGANATTRLKLLREYGFEILQNLPGDREVFVKIARLSSTECTNWGRLDRSLFFCDPKAHFMFLEGIRDSDHDLPLAVEIAIRAGEDALPILEESKSHDPVPAQGVYARTLVVVRQFDRPRERLWLYQELKMYTDIIEECPPRECLGNCHRFADLSLWEIALRRLARGDSDVLKEFLDGADRGVLHLQIVLREVAAARKHPPIVLKAFLEAEFAKELEARARALKGIEEARSDLTKHRSELAKLNGCVPISRTADARVYFLCGHSSNNGEDKVCRECSRGLHDIFRARKERIEAWEGAAPRGIDPVEEAEDGFHFVKRALRQSVFATGSEILETQQAKNDVNKLLAAIALD